MKNKFDELFKSIPAAPHLAEFPQDTIAWLIGKRLDEARMPGARRIGESQEYTYLRLQKAPIGKKPHYKLKVVDFVEHCRSRRATGVLPQTIMQDFTALASLIRHAVEVWELPDSGLVAIKKAKPQLIREQLIGKSIPRNRRPTPEELRFALELAAVEDARPRNKILMVPTIEFSYTAARRISETCRITRKDVDVEKRLCTVRDLKNPNGKGYHDTFPLLGRAWEIVEQRLKVIPDEPDARLFPFNSKSCSARYTMMKIKLRALHPGLFINLRLHDNRREAISRLFEQGFNVPEVQKVSLHRTPTLLLRTYTSLKPEDLHKGPAAKRAQP
jgi:integrase